MTRHNLPRRKVIDDAGRLTAYLPAETVRKYKNLKELGIDVGKLVREAVVQVLDEAERQLAQESA